jgi:DNA-binding NtrC family response regulator
MNNSSRTVLVVEDNQAFTYSLTLNLTNWGYQVFTVGNGNQAKEFLDTTPVSLILLDLKLPDIHGFKVLEYIQKFQYPPEVIILTGDEDIETAVKAMQLGAFDYLTKPIDMEELYVRVLKASRVTDLRVKLREYETDELSEIIGVSPAIRQIRNLILQLQETDITVLLLGESGVGKEIVARAMHRYSKRSNGPFVVINCAAIPENLLESELFGHERGAFTGAIGRHIGKFERSNSGTIFLDEIGEMNLATQVRILRVLEDKAFERVGGHELIKVDTRIIAATNQPLLARVESGSFRDDLYYRLAVYPITIPPLRERPEDIPQLFAHFIATHSAPNKPPEINNEILDILTAYSWPGNVRELRNAVQRILITAKDDRIIRKSHLSFLNFHSDVPFTSHTVKTLDQIEQEAILSALSRHKGNISHAAKDLNIGRDTLYRKIKTLKINLKQYT